MRYIGQKTKLLENIEELLSKKNIISKDLVFCDAFSGTATVGSYFKDKFKKIISNDNLYFSYIIAQAKLNTKYSDTLFEKLGFDPFDYFNNIEIEKCQGGFIYENYAPSSGGRQFFTDENAKLIDFIRESIDVWYDLNKITIQEKYYLIACLIESLSFVSNIAGVYGACLKIWDNRALKRMEFKKLDIVGDFGEKSDVYNEDVLTFIENVEGDVLYLDPPYTKNVYTTQYHLLETVAKKDSPIISGKGGLRDMSMYSTSFSKTNEAEVALENLIRNAKFKHIVMSYSSDGIISEDFIEALFKRYGKDDTFESQKITYRRYKNSRAEDNSNHKEYLFYFEKKDKSDICYSSPLNYIGGKGDMVYWLKKYMPDDINTFYDLFGGGANISINACADSVIYNDINFKVKELLEYIANTETKQLLFQISQKIKKYDLKNGNKESYLKLRENYNNSKKKDFIEFFLLIMYGFQQQIRFNSKFEFNNPIGQAGYNEKIKEKLVTFSEISKKNKIVYLSNDFSHYREEIQNNDFVYIDPPYLITLGSYNDGKRGFNGWCETEEIRLLEFLDFLNSRGVRFMLSNVIEHKGKTNELLKNWVSKNHLKTIYYQGKTRGNREEVIIINYKI